MMGIANIITWAIIGLIAGTLSGAIVTRQKAGFGFWQNVGLGFGGAIVGGLVFGLFNILPGLDSISVSVRDVVAAVFGSLILLAGFWFWKRR